MEGESMDIDGPSYHGLDTYDAQIRRLCNLMHPHQPVLPYKPVSSEKKRGYDDFARDLNQPGPAPGPAPFNLSCLKYSPQHFATPAPIIKLRRTPSPELSIKARMSPYQNNKLVSPSILFPNPRQRRAKICRGFTPPPPSEPFRPLRRIGGMFTSLFVISVGLIAFVWDCITHVRQPAHQEIIAVETDASGKKRRAIEAGSPTSSPDASPSSTSLLGQPKRVPGGFPTPPETRYDSPMEGMADLKDDTVKNEALVEAAAQITLQRSREMPVTDTVRQSKLAEPSQAADLRDCDFHLPAGTIRPKPKTLADYPKPKVVTSRKLAPPNPDKPVHTKSSSAYPSSERRKRSVLPAEARPKATLGRTFPTPQAGASTTCSLSASQIRNAQRDTEVDALVERAQRAYIESPEEKTLRESYRQRKKQEEQVEEQAELARLKEEAEEKAKADQKAAEEAAVEEARKIAAAEEQAKLSRKESLIRPLDPEWQDKVDNAMRTKSASARLATTTSGTELTRTSFGTLLPQAGSNDRPSGWLDDEVVNGWMDAICTRKLEQTGYKKGANNVPAYAAFNTGWYQNYKMKGIDSIKGWSRRKQIKGEKLLQAEKIFFPVNPGAHWMLIIISPKDRTIEFLDSLNQGGRTREQYFKAARAWLAMELGAGYKAADWTETQSMSAWQQNSDDCGVFTCFNALAAAKGVDFEEVGNGRMSDARRIMAAVLLNGGLTGDFEL